MRKPRWRVYPVGEFYFHSLALYDDGIVMLGQKRLREDEPIDVLMEDKYRITRPGGFGQFLVVETPHGMPLLFRFEDGTWMRWIHLHRVGQWRFWIHDVVRTWGVGSPFVFAGLAVLAYTVVRGAYLLLSGTTLAVLSAITLITWLIGSGVGHRRHTPRTDVSHQSRHASKTSAGS